jgi:hypothetical protein
MVSDSFAAIPVHPCRADAQTASIELLRGRISVLGSNIESLGRLVYLLIARYREQRDITHLYDAQKVLREAVGTVKLTDATLLDAVDALTAHFIFHREPQESVKPVDAAIELHEEMLSAVPPGHPSYRSLASRLSRLLFMHHDVPTTGLPSTQRCPS